MVVVCASLWGLPTIQTAAANTQANKKLNNGPAKATMALSSGVMGGSDSVLDSPSRPPMGAICGRATKPPAGMLPRPYSTPLMVFFHRGLPNQM